MCNTNSTTFETMRQSCKAAGLTMRAYFTVYTDWFRLYCRFWRLMFSMRSKALRYRCTLRALEYALVYLPARIVYLEIRQGFRIYFGQ